MTAALNRKLLNAIYRIGVHDQDGMPIDDPRLYRIAEDAGIELVEDDPDNQQEPTE